MARAAVTRNKRAIHPAIEKKLVGILSQNRGEILEESEECRALRESAWFWEIRFLARLIGANKARKNVTLTSSSDGKIEVYSNGRVHCNINGQEVVIHTGNSDDYNVCFDDNRSNLFPIGHDYSASLRPIVEAMVTHLEREEKNPELPWQGINPYVWNSLLRNSTVVGLADCNQGGIFIYEYPDVSRIFPIDSTYFITNSKDRIYRIGENGFFILKPDGSIYLRDDEGLFQRAFLTRQLLDYAKRHAPEIDLEPEKKPNDEWLQEAKRLARALKEGSEIRQESDGPPRSLRIIRIDKDGNFRFFIGDKADDLVFDSSKDYDPNNRNDLLGFELAMRDGLSMMHNQFSEGELAALSRPLVERVEEVTGYNLGACDIKYFNYERGDSAGLFRALPESLAVGRLYKLGDNFLLKMGDRFFSISDTGVMKPIVSAAEVEELLVAAESQTPVVPQGDRKEERRIWKLSDDQTFNDPGTSVKYFLVHPFSDTSNSQLLTDDGKVRESFTKWDLDQKRSNKFRVMRDVYRSDVDVMRTFEHIIIIAAQEVGLPFETPEERKVILDIIERAKERGGITHERLGDGYKKAAPTSSEEDRVARAFSAKFQEIAGKCGILTGREGENVRPVGCRLTFVPLEAVINFYKETPASEVSRDITYDKIKLVLEIKTKAASGQGAARTA